MTTPLCYHGVRAATEVNKQMWPCSKKEFLLAKKKKKAGQILPAGLRLRNPALDNNVGHQNSNAFIASVELNEVSVSPC